MDTEYLSHIAHKLFVTQTSAAAMPDPRPRHVFTFESSREKCGRGASICVAGSDSHMSYCTKEVSITSSPIIKTPSTRFRHDCSKSDMDKNLRTLNAHVRPCAIVCFLAHYECGCRVSVVQISMDIGVYPAHVQHLKNAITNGAIENRTPFAFPQAFVAHQGAYYPYVLIPGPTLKMSTMETWYTMLCCTNATAFGLRKRKKLLSAGSINVHFTTMQPQLPSHGMEVLATSHGIDMIVVEKQRPLHENAAEYEIYNNNRIVSGDLLLRDQWERQIPTLAPVPMKCKVNFGDGHELVPDCKFHLESQSTKIPHVQVVCDRVHFVFDPEACRRVANRMSPIIPINGIIMDRMPTSLWRRIPIKLGPGGSDISGIQCDSLNSDQRQWLHNWQNCAGEFVGVYERSIIIRIPTKFLKPLHRFDTPNVSFRVSELWNAIADPHPATVPIVIENGPSNAKNDKLWTLTNVGFLLEMSSRTVSVLAAATGMGKSFFMAATAYAIATTKKLMVYMIVPPHLLFQTAQMLVDEHLRVHGGTPPGGGLAAMARIAIAAAARGDMSSGSLSTFAKEMKYNDIRTVLHHALGEDVANCIYVHPSNMSQAQWHSIQTYLPDPAVIMIDEAHTVMRKSVSPLTSAMEFKSPLRDIVDEDEFDLMGSNVHILLASANLETPSYGQASFMTNLTVPAIPSNMTPRVLLFPKKTHDQNMTSDNREMCCWNVPYIDPPSHRLSQRGESLPWIKSDGLPWHPDMPWRSRADCPPGTTSRKIGAMNWIMHMGGRQIIASMFRAAADPDRLNRVISAAMANMPARGGSFDELVAAIRAELVGCSETAAQTIAMMNMEDGIEEQPMCAICMCEMEATEQLIHIRCCHAIFHKDCIEAHANATLRNNTMSCPMCRHATRWPDEVDLLVSVTTHKSMAEKRQREEVAKVSGNPVVQQMADVLTRVRARARKGTLIFVHIGGKVFGGSNVTDAFRRRPEIALIEQATRATLGCPKCIVSTRVPTATDGPRPCMVLPYGCISGMNLQHAFDSVMVVGYPDPAGPSAGDRAQLEGRIMRQGQDTPTENLGVGFVPVLSG